jgi:hypothetical protein
MTNHTNPLRDGEFLSDEKPARASNSRTVVLTLADGTAHRQWFANAAAQGRAVNTEKYGVVVAVAYVRVSN